MVAYVLLFVKDGTSSRTTGENPSRLPHHTESSRVTALF